MDCASQSSKLSNDKSPYFQMPPKNQNRMCKRKRKRKRKRRMVDVDSRSSLFEARESDAGVNG